MQKRIVHKCYSIDIAPKYCYLYFGKDMVARRKFNDSEIELETINKMIDKYIKNSGYTHYLQILSWAGIKADRKDENVYLEYLSSEYVTLLRRLKNRVSEVLTNEIV